jgi:hypothetical protein
VCPREGQVAGADGEESRPGIVALGVPGSSQSPAAADSRSRLSWRAAGSPRPPRRGQPASYLSPAGAEHSRPEIQLAD